MTIREENYEYHFDNQGKRTICCVKTILPTREEMLTLMKGSLFVQMEEDGIEERDDSVKDLVIIIMVLW